MKIKIMFALVLIPFAIKAQQYTLKGNITDTTGKPIAYATTSLLKDDSTLEAFSISNTSGEFEIKNITKGNYLMQVASMNYKTLYINIDIPYSKETLGKIILQNVSKELKEVQVTTERVPFRIKNDTLEYNAGSFKTKPDANTEDLLKKLPGIQVDEAGNIKAQGEDVKKILVDGKEFFGDDPKVASKNLPADAINKIQVFNKKSDATEFTGIDDGQRDKTINLVLKDGRKAGYFGDLEAGKGTEDKYKLSAKLFDFKKNSQFAALGMLNNINQFGFSLTDYLSFIGGMRGLANGDAFGSNNAPPINFGQPVTGLTTSGAGGLNYTYEKIKNNRVNISFLSNGASKDLLQQTMIKNFVNNDFFNRYDTTWETTKNFAQRLNIGIRKDMDSSRQFTFNSSAGLTQNKTWNTTLSSSSIQDLVLNHLDSRTMDNGSGILANARMSYLKRTEGNWSIIKVSGDVNYDKELTKTEWQNLTTIIQPGTIINDQQFQNNNTEKLKYSATASILRNLGNKFYLEPEMNAGISDGNLSRKQGALPEDSSLTDSLSPVFARQYKWLRPGLSLKRSTEKTQWNAGVKAEKGFLSSTLNNQHAGTQDCFYLLPYLNWQKEISGGKRLNFNYRSSVVAPEVEQMLPIANAANPLQVFTGNNKLRPQYDHTASVYGIWSDEFSFSSLFANLSAKYTHDKISWSRTIQNDLTQIITPVNISDDYSANARIEYSKPIRKLHINTDISLNEQFEKGINIVNGINNQTITLSHELRLSVGNRKKEKWDVQIGWSINLSDAKYSIYTSLNNKYSNVTGFTDISYRPNDHWYFLVSANISHYNAESFDKAVYIPLLKAETSYYFLKANRGILTLSTFDLLNMNTGIQRVSELNYLKQTTSNIIGRFFMLSFKYRLSNTGKGTQDNIKVNVSG